MRTQNFKFMLGSLFILAILLAPIAQLSRMGSASGGDDIRAIGSQKMCSSTLADPGFRYIHRLATGRDSLNDRDAVANCQVGCRLDGYHAHRVGRAGGCNRRRRNRGGLTGSAAHTCRDGGYKPEREVQPDAA